MAIIGLHAIVYSTKHDATRAFFKDVLGLPSVDAGRGWLIFQAPPAEIAVHPSEEDGHHELFLMCDDIDATVAELKAKGVRPSRSQTSPGAADAHRPAERPELGRPSEASDGDRA